LGLQELANKIVELLGLLELRQVPCIVDHPPSLIARREPTQLLGSQDQLKRLGHPPADPTYGWIHLAEDRIKDWDRTI
jgi:hypothetical protein